MISQQDITAVILAGGKGRRLGGQDKGLVHYKDKPLIEHVIQRIQPQVNHILLNANRNLETYATYGFPLIRDELSDFQGPLAGLITAMKTVQTSHIITLPCDGPFLPNDLVSRMLNELIKSSKSLDNTIMVAHTGERLQPVYALIPVSLLANLEQYIEKGERKIETWHRQNTMLSVDFSDKAAAFNNINTEEQRQKFEKS